jgi:Flp pilus assembly protein TadB
MRNDPHHDDGPRVAGMLGEIIDLSAGLGIILLPLFTIAIPGVLLMLVLPAVLLALVAAAPLVIAGALLGPPYLLVRLLRRRHRSRA